MNDEHLDQLLAKARDSYRVPPEPPVDDMWGAIEAELDVRSGGTRAVPRRGRDWRVAGFAAAAALVFGVGIGRWSAPQAPVAPAPNVAMVPDESVPVHQVGLAEPLQRAATNYFGETAQLFQDMQENPKGTYARQASALLSKTRLLLDSPAAANQRMHDLLEDLEMMFAQIAMVRADESVARKHQDLQMIRTALEERELVPRVRTAVVTLASSED